MPLLADSFTPFLIIGVPLEVQSMNAWMYQHWRAYMKVRDEWMVYLRVRLAPRARPPAVKTFLRITSRRGRLIDYANFIGGAKPIPDCLTRLNYIHNDSPAWFECDYHQLLAPKPMRGTTIEFLTPNLN